MRVFFCLTLRRKLAAASISSTLRAMTRNETVRSLGICLLAMGLAASSGLAQTGPYEGQNNDSARQALTLKSDPAGVRRIHRLILKDGSFQTVREYEVKGNRVRYRSSERGGAWEELPAELVDWEATRKWEQQQTDANEDISPAMKAAREIDKEESEERVNEQARMPEVAVGLNLPDQSGVFALDDYRGAPELVELVPDDLNMNQKTRRGVNLLNPLAGQRANLELDGAHARVHLHTTRPAIYLSLDAGDERDPVLTHALQVDAGNAKNAANGKHGAQSANSGFALVRADERRAVRIIGAIRVGPTGKASRDENVIPAKSEILPGKHWMKIEPVDKLAVGEYALVEILSATEMNQTVWDFRIDPSAGINPGSLGAIHKDSGER